MSKPSDSTLMSWWRKAVKAVQGESCVLCGATPVECHHIIKRRKKLTRYDWRNGLPLCPGCHSLSDTIRGREAIAEHVDMDYLRDHDGVILKEWLASHGMTEQEFLQAELDELKDVVAHPDAYRLMWVPRR
jgi:ankyrin repeat protein